jgi:hypothetical protein
VNELAELSNLKPVIGENGGIIVRAINAVRSLAPVDCLVVHTFTPHLYSRKLHVPKGTFVVTKKHKTEHPYVVSKGKMSVWTADGGVEIIEAPYSGITKPGTQRIAFAHEDTIWQTFHPTDKTDVDEIEKDIIEPTIESIMVQADVVAQLQEAK